MANERKTDIFISRLLENVGIKYTPNGSDNIEIQKALKTASKKGTGKSGFPEFTAIVQDFVLVIENKAEQEKQALYTDDDNTILSIDTKAITDYAENGALHYANEILTKTNFKKVFAFGCSGDEKHHIIKPLFVDATGYKLLDKVENFENFSAANIEQYYREQILGETPPKILETQELLKKATELHEALRNYGQLGDKEKPLVVSAILLALADKNNFNSNQLTGDNVNTDGNKIFRSIETYMTKVQVTPETKKEKVLNQFILVKDRTILNQIDERLSKTPLKFFTEFVETHILHSIKANIKGDVLGNFYSEFMRYGGGDGQSLGVVLTPDHITELFCDLVELKPTDMVFDPCCGTAAFLIAAMHRMEKMTNDPEQKKHIKSDQLHGIEIREDMFSIATTNMILRDDGKSNLVPANFLTKPATDLRKNNFTVGFMNPPYSQAKGKDTVHLSEVHFIEHLLNSLADGARCVVIVPQSTMVGKTNEDKKIKQRILEKHSLEGVITLNKETFYRIGVNPCIAVFTAHKAHDFKKRCKFINFEDDGFETRKHIGITETERAKSQKAKLLDCWFDRADADSKFMVKTAIEATDEWLHSFYYFNDEIPKEADFEKAIADYLTFEFSMIMQGRDYLFDSNTADEKKKPEPELIPLKQKAWGEFEIGRLFTIENCKCSNVSLLQNGNISYVGATNKNNGVLKFVKPIEKMITTGNCIAFICDGEGSIGYAIYKNEDFVGSTTVKVGRNEFLNRYTASFLTTIADTVRNKYNFGFKRNEVHLKKEKLLLPITDEGAPDYAYMEAYMRRIEAKLLRKYVDYVSLKIKALGEKGAAIPLKQKEWGEFYLNEVFVEIQRGKRFKKDDHKKGIIPYVSSSALNNGIDAFVGKKENIRIFSNCLTIANSGSIGATFYQPFSFVASDHVTKLQNNDLNAFIYLFIASIIKRLNEKYSFNREINDARIQREKLLLPITPEGAPDYAYMEAYMQRITYEKLTAYLQKKL